MKLGIALYGLSAIALGVIDIVWGQFESAHQPLQAWGDNLPGNHVFAYVLAVLLVAGGVAVLLRRTAKVGAAAIGLVYAIFAVFWLPRLVTAPSILGQHFAVYAGVIAGICTETIVVAAAFLIYASTLPAESSAVRWGVAARWVFGIGAIAFGLGHITNVANNAKMVPGWMPLGLEFWVYFTGVAFVLAGIAFLTQLADVLAARLLALMLLIFSAFALVPIVFAYPHSQIAWGSNAYNLLAVASAWILACWFAQRHAGAPRVAAGG